MTEAAIPLPAKFMAPWIADNSEFTSELAVRNRRLEEEVPKLRAKMLDNGSIKAAKPADRAQIGAVDAAVIKIPLHDMTSILIQCVRVSDDGTTTLANPSRYTGINGHETLLLATPMRVAAECAELARSETITIADTSFWSLLMEVNQAINLKKNSCNNEILSYAVRHLVQERSFLDMIKNRNVIAMSKSNQSDKLIKGISDREVYGRILAAGEYKSPVSLTEGTTGSFGVANDDFTKAEQTEIREIYNSLLGVMYFKPHPWSRAYRIEARMIDLKNDNFIMPLFAGITHHTMVRSIIEPYPQYAADYMAKSISCVSVLYGDYNTYRMPPSVPTRTAA